MGGKAFAERHLRRGHDAGSRLSEKNQQERLNELEMAARQSYNLVALWKWQEELQYEKPKQSLSPGS